MKRIKNLVKRTSNYRIVLPMLTVLLILSFANYTLFQKKEAVEIVESVEAITENRIEVGLNVGKEIDQIIKTRNFQAVSTKYLRLFELQGDAYPDYQTPATASPVMQVGIKWKFAGTVDRLKKLKAAGFEIQVSIEEVFERTPSGLKSRGFPNKWYTAQEWGGTSANIQHNAYQYAMLFTEQLTGVVDVLEIGNEPWGEPGVSAWQDIARGTIAAFKERYGEDVSKWPMKLAAPALQATKQPYRFNCPKCPYKTGDYVGDFLTAEFQPYISVLTIHPYAFRKGTLELTESPDSEQGEFAQFVNDMIMWRNQNMPDKPIYITEFGYDSGTVGEEKQAKWLIEAAELARSWGIERIYFYELVDNPGLKGLYSSSGIYSAKNGRELSEPKLSYFALKNYIEGKEPDNPDEPEMWTVLQEWETKDGKTVRLQELQN